MNYLQRRLLFFQLWRLSAPAQLRTLAARPAGRPASRLGRPLARLQRARSSASISLFLTCAARELARGEEKSLQTPN